MYSVSFSLFRRMEQNKPNYRPKMNLQWNHYFEQPNNRRKKRLYLFQNKISSKDNSIVHSNFCSMYTIQTHWLYNIQYIYYTLLSNVLLVKRVMRFEAIVLYLNIPPAWFNFRFLHTILWRAQCLFTERKWSDFQHNRLPYCERQRQLLQNEWTFSTTYIYTYIYNIIFNIKLKN